MCATNLAPWSPGCLGRARYLHNSSLFMKPQQLQVMPWRWVFSASSLPTFLPAGMLEWISPQLLKKHWEVLARTLYIRSLGDLYAQRVVSHLDSYDPTSHLFSPSLCGGGTHASGFTAILPSPPQWTESFEFKTFRLWCHCFPVVLF